MGYGCAALAGLLMAIGLAGAAPAAADKDIALTDSDFVVSHQGRKITLDGKYHDFLSGSGEKEQPGVFVGDVLSGNVSYKTYQYHYAHYDLYTSNLFYDKKGRDAAEYYITQIAFTKNDIKTARGISLGDPLETVERIYGPGNRAATDGETWLAYDRADKSLSFRITDNYVDKIILAVVATDAGQAETGQEQESIRLHNENSDKAVMAVYSWMKENNITDLADVCLAYEFDDESSAQYFIVSVRENNRHEECHGDPDVSPLLLTVRVDRISWQLSTDKDSVDGQFRPVN
ncbi:hypothetical protein FJU30_22705 [Affinibrenneria salicis]|uniref:DUF3108 domain-containing protein n=1 Tax=Affinibrenneria salicis TaxID=2590031 RepID=A0A5J5FTL4_9GAMM|nr:hypothetical protein [Affinibrenneria salicis]KAA8996175.1 hypothetical protein FJU30_22705 [Affinibrenneria salicis]